MNGSLQREHAASNEKWDLTHIYPGMKDWDDDYIKALELIEAVKTYEDNIKNASQLLEFLKQQEELSFTYEKLFVYASLKLDEDTRITDSQALVDKARGLGTQIRAASSFFRPFLLSLEKETLEHYIQQEPDLDYFKDDLYEEFKYKPYILSKDQEEILSQLGEVIAAPKTIFGMINNADIRFGEVSDDKGAKTILTRGMYSRLLESHDRNKRREAFQAYYKPYVELKNTIAATLGAAVKNNVLFSKIRNYPSPLYRSLFADNVPVSLYENLIRSTNENLAPMHRYMNYRKAFLNVDELHVYDLSVPLVEDVEMNIPYDEAYEIMLQALAPLGNSYMEVLKRAKDGGWIDVYETQGKRSGAYNWGPYGTHPYVLLNHNQTLDSLFTLVHEMGHALHSYLSDLYQPRNKAQYTIFVAEVASTVNEVLLIHHLLNGTNDPKLKRYLLNHFIDQFKGTFFSQVMFAEFEKTIHEKGMNGEALTADSLSSIYESLFRSYHGEALVLDSELKYGWSRIPHFYNAFYVYKYATGFASAIEIASRIVQGDKETVKTYLEFLKSGGSDYPLELLQRTGVDLLQPEPIENTLTMFDDLVQKLESTPAR